jgi:dimethylamine/trimethylamine dehydrogenase
MDKNDIKNIRQWHRDAAKRALEAGFDIVYVYATHGYLLSEFLNPETNIRTDEYGGSLENRVRFIKELIEDTREVVDGKAAVATRFSVGLNDPESYDAFALLAELPDLWDLTVPDYSVEMGNSRFIKEAALKDSVLKAKQLTSKPVVSVGRLTSPDTMVQLLKDNVQDLIGAARPSIADPFLPNKISTGNLEDIRECIGCNVCYAHDSLGVPIRCTQNPTMGEEWRNGWHPEKILTTKNKKRVLVVGSGPAGLEASRVLGKMGHKVALAEKSRELGGRIITEAKLPGLSEWIRVRDWRITQINKCENIEVFPESIMTADSVLELGYENVVIATGARWAKDSIGRHSDSSFKKADMKMIVSGDEVLENPIKSKSKFVIYDDDHYYFGSVLALELKRQGHEVTLVSPAGRVCSWGEFTDEQTRSNTEIIKAGIKVINNYKIEVVMNGIAELSCIFSGETKEVSCDFVVPITRKIPVTDLYDHLYSRTQDWKINGIRKVIRIGDAEAPSIIAAAVHSGYRSAIEVDDPSSQALNFSKREHPLIR